MPKFFQINNSQSLVRDYLGRMVKILKTLTIESTLALSLWIEIPKEDYSSITPKSFLL
jgi:hypothetical protein